MSIPDWIVLLSTLILITVYGIYKGRGSKNIEGYLLGNKTMPWYTIGLSIMATQASAITFLSAPGQAFTDGMRFVQFYFGLPLAMVVLCVTVVPIFHRMKIYTAYEYLETRFDLKTRTLGALLFLVQRGLAAGLTIYAPAIILSSLLGWNLFWTNIFMGIFVVIYTVAGGTRAVSYTQLGQMAIIFSGIGLAAWLLFRMLPPEMTFTDIVSVAGKSGKMNIVDLHFDPDNRYNVWSGLIGGFFLAMSYFGTDQSQVGRYLSGKSITEIRLGLLFNGLVKIPMQLFILFIGAMLYVFYIFQPQPLFFNETEVAKIKSGAGSHRYERLESEFRGVQELRKEAALTYVNSIHGKNAISPDQAAEALILHDRRSQEIRKEVKQVLKEANSGADTNDTNYIFLKYVTDFLPKGIIGLLIAVIFAASMSSTSSELNALASTTVVDIYKRSMVANGNEKHYVMVSKWATVVWGLFAIAVAEFANRMGSLIEAVNILGSLFYGTILGIFMCGFYLPKTGANSVFMAALIAECLVIYCYFFTGISFLWYNVIGCIILMLLAVAFQRSGINYFKTKKPAV